MSTRSAIIAKRDNGYAGIYCHFDGYIEGGVGETLHRHYQDPAKIAALIDLGDISQLGERVTPAGTNPGLPPHSYASPEPGTTVAYGRDRGETGTEPRTFDALEDGVESFRKSWCEYIYIFDGVEWTVSGKPLAGHFTKRKARARAVA
jgi:hypothetical protein